MAKDYSRLAQEVVESVGGRTNIRSVTHCITRLRFVLTDETVADDKQIKLIEGVIDVIRAGGQVQVVIGTHVDAVFKSIFDQGLIDEATNGVPATVGKFSLLDVLSGVFMPVVGGMVATGILKGILIMCSVLGWVDPACNTYAVLYAASDAFFYFLPMALAVSAAKKFGCNQYVAFAVAAVLVYPDLVASMSAEGGIDFLGIPVTTVSYSSSVIPAVASIAVLALLEKQLSRIVPEVVRGVVVPLVCLVVMVPLTLIVIGPVTTWLGEIVAAAYSFLYGLSPAVAGVVMAGLWPMLIVLGAHTASLPIALNNMAVYGGDTLLPVTTGTNYSIAGAALAVALKTKNAKLKETGLSSGFSALVGGVTEPAIYGVVLKYKRPFYICMGATALGGLVAGIAGSTFTAWLTTCVLTLPAMATFPGGWGFVAAAAVGFVGAFVGTYLWGFNDSMLADGEC